MAPELSSRVLYSDNDIRMAVFYLTNLATILEYLQKTLLRSDADDLNFQINVENFSSRMLSYEIVFDTVIEDFNNSMFGPYNNSVSREHFER